MTAILSQDPNAVDDQVEGQIQACLDLDKPSSFFLYAGAGSGKTRSLVNALEMIRHKYGRRLWLNGQRVGVITYTNAACDEIKERISHSVLFDVSTIHSFAWTLIGSYQSDIRNWLRSNLVSEIEKIKVAHAKGRSGTKASAEREASLKSKAERLAFIETVKKFQYSPTGENTGRDALNHSEVINMAVAFLMTKPTMQSILAGRYPILLVDESQDTNKNVMDALLNIQQSHRSSFSLGLFGDTMQRIYADGKIGLESAIPSDWVKPEKKMNHRCPRRVLQLLNHMRDEVDHKEQRGRTDKPQGYVRLFVLPANTPDKPRAELGIATRMAEITGDRKWIDDYKALILEHHMAAKRLGFTSMFEALHKVDRLKTGLLDGSLPSVRFFANQALPLVEAMQRGDRFAAATIVKKNSVLLDPKKLRSEKEQLKQLQKAKSAVDDLLSLWNDGSEPTFKMVLDSLYRSDLFEIPEVLRVLASRHTADSL